MVIAQPFNQWLQKELNSLMNEHSLSYVAIDVTYDLAMQGIIWPLTGQGVWDSLAETFVVADYVSEKNFKME